jgi:phospholipid/cholesterol/gamma-HCH transport system substrate-binding protein
MSASFRATNVRAGIFVVTALALLVASSLWILGSGTLTGEGVAYQVVLRDSAGVEVGDRVRLAGVAVGRIQDVELRADDEWPVVLTISIRSKITVREDSSAVMTTSGLLGSSFLQLLPGSPDAELLPPGAIIRGQPPGGMDGAIAQVDALANKLMEVLDQTAGTLDEVADQLQPVLVQLSRLLDDENLDRFSAVLVEMRETFDGLSERVGPLLARLESLAESIESGLEGVPELSDRMTLLLADISTVLGPEGAHLSEMLQTLQRTLGTADETLLTVNENRGDIEATLQNLREAVGHFEAFSKQINERPSRLIRKLSPPDRRPGQGAGGDGR